MKQKPVKFFKQTKGKKKQTPLGDIVIGTTVAIVGTALVLESAKLIGANS